MATDERMILNSALEKLTNGWDENSAKLVVGFGNKLTKARRLTCEFISRHQDKGNITGHTNKGDVTINTSQPEETKEINWGVKKERIGWFRLWKAKKGVLYFHHFWASDITTISANPENKPPEYKLEYNPKTLIPFSLSIRQEKEILKLGIVTISYSYLVPVYGKPKKQFFKHSYYVLKIGC